MAYFSEADLAQLAPHVASGTFWSPKFVKLTLLDGCNWRCQMCRCDKTAPALLSVEQWLTVVRGVLRLGTREISFTGGEPTLYPDFEGLLAGIRALDAAVKLKLLTNGTRLDQRRVETFLALGLRRYIVSVHGSSAEVHDPIVGVANQWGRTLRGIERLVSASPGVPRSVWINCVVRRANLGQMVGVVRLASSLGCEGVSFSPLDNRVSDPGVEPLSVAEMQAARETILPEVREVARQQGLLLFPADAEIFGHGDEDLQRVARGELSRGHYETHPCYWVYYHLTIEPDGTVQPCCNRPLRGGYGNALVDPPEELLKGPRAVSFLGLAGRGPAALLPCRGCEMKLQVNRAVHQGLQGQGLAARGRRALPVWR